MEQDDLCTLERCYKCSQYHCWYNRTEQEAGARHELNRRLSNEVYMNHVEEEGKC